MVPKLVVALRNGKCEQFQKLRKFTNCEKIVKDFDFNSTPEETEIKETAILDDNYSDSEMPLTARSQGNSLVPVKVMMNSRGQGCDTTLAKTQVGIIITEKKKILQHQRDIRSRNCIVQHF